VAQPFGPALWPSPLFWKGLPLAPPSQQRAWTPWAKTTPLYPPLEHVSLVECLPWRTLGSTHLGGRGAPNFLCSAFGLQCSALLLSFALA
jgi:hypothetical protein